MREIKKEFENWLIKKGFSQKTSKGRPGSVYEYIRNIDKVCDIVRLNHNDEAWIWLANNIYPILGFYLICKNGLVHIDRKNKAKLENYLSIFLDCLGGEYRENAQKYFMIESGYKDEQAKKQYIFISTFVLQYLGEQPEYELDLSINLQNSVANNQRKALQKFYDFLKVKRYDPKSSDFLLNLSKEEKNEKSQLLKDHYFAISTGFKVLTSNKNLNQNIFYLTLSGGGYYSAPKLSTDNDEAIEKEKVMEILHLSDWSLRMLHDLKKLSKLQGGYYSVKDVDAYISDAFKEYQDKVKKQTGQDLTKNKKNLPTAKEIKVWWTGKEIHDKFGISTRYIIKLRVAGKIPYLKLVNKKYLYYPYAFKKYAKVNKRFVRIHDKNINLSSKAK